MSVVGIVAEYNPFHNGHKYHLEKSISLTKSNYSIALMSSSFLQRGEPAFVDKWTRAKMAVDNGVDLVIELPFIYASQSAELFSLGAIKILNSLNIIDYLSFGSENGNLEPLNIIADILANESPKFKEILAHNLALGKSFPVSRSIAIEAELEDKKLNNAYNSKAILKQSNNILAIEYLKALKNTDSNIKPVTIKRKGSGYKESSLSNFISSATAIRATIVKEDLHAVIDHIPTETYFLLKEFLTKYKDFNSLENYKEIIRYLFLIKDREEIKNLFDVEEGLENRIIKFIKKYDTIEGIVDSISTKRYASTRIQRIFIHLLMDLYRDDIKRAYFSNPGYIRILASNIKGLELLSKIKSSTSIDIVTKFSNYKKFNNQTMNEFLYFEKKATDIYYLGLNEKSPSVDMDYYNTLYIKKHAENR